MKRVFMTAVVAALAGIPTLLRAQDDKKSGKETEEVIIRKNGDKEMNLKVEINGDKVTVNGKPLSEFSDDQVTINKRKMIIRDGDNVMSLDLGPNGGQAFSFGDGFWGNFDKNNDEKSGAFLGVTTEKTDDGVKIKEVVKESAAEKAGLQKDDIITKVDGKKIEDAAGLSDVISSMKPGAEVKINYKRNGKNNHVTATLGERKIRKSMAYTFRGPDGDARSFSFPGDNGVQNREFFDDRLEALDQAREEMEMKMPRQKKIGLKIQDTEEGGNVKVIGVEDGSAAATAGLQKDDVITEIDGVKINNTDDAREQLHPAENKSLYKIKAKRNGAEMNFEVKIPKKLKTANL